MTITNSNTNDKLLYSFMGTRLLAYFLFFLINLGQVYLEIKYLKNKKRKKETRLFVFSSIALFCMFRVIQTAFFYSNPNLGLGTLNFFFFSFGSAMIFIQWTFIIQFWLLIMYSFFVSEDITQYRTRPIRIMTIAFAIVVIIYQTIVSTITLDHNIDTAESIGFIILLLIFATIILFNGYFLIKHLKIHRKVTPMKHFDLMIFKTKILLATVIIVVIGIVVQELIFNMYYTDTYETSKQYLKLFIIGVIEFFQMVVVMLVLSNGHWSNYILISKVKLNSETTSSSSSKKPSRDKDKEYETSGNTLTMGEDDSYDQP